MWCSVQIACYYIAMKEQATGDVEILWQYMQCHQPPADADCLLVLGCRDDRVAERASWLCQTYHYGIVMASGGVAPHNEVATSWPEPTEAEHFAAVMKQAGCKIPILLEKQAKNTGENASNSFLVLQKHNVPIPRTIQLVTKPYMERRAVATFEAQWPDKNSTFRATSPGLSFADYINDEQTYDDVVSIMVGDMQRIIEYPKRGYQSEQPVPRYVYDAFCRLVAGGYDRRLLKT